MRILNYGQPVNRQAPLNRGLVGWWLGTPLRSGGLTLFDLMGKNHGTLVGGPTWSPGKVGKALNFDGTNDAVSIGSPAALDNLAALTYTAWVFPIDTGQAGAGRIISKEGIGYKKLLMQETASMEFAVSRATTETDSIASNNSLTLNEWQFVAVTWNGTNAAKLYVNGVETSYVAQVAGTGVVTSDAAENLYIGRNHDAAIREFHGSIDDVRIYSRALSADEVRALYQASSTGYQRELNWLVDDDAYAIAGGPTPISVGDSGVGNDAIHISALLAILEDGAGSDGIAISALVAIAESALGSDSEIVQNLVSLNETGQGDDQIAVAAAIAILETAAGAETLDIKVQLTIGDPGTGDDVVVGGVQINIDDVGSGVDVGDLRAAVSVAETALGSDNLAVAALLQIIDAASGEDQVALAAAIDIAESALGADSPAVLALVGVQESGQGLDTVAVSVVVAILESAIGSEGTTVTIAGNAMDIAFSAALSAGNATGKLSAGDVNGIFIHA